MKSRTILSQQEILKAQYSYRDTLKKLSEQIEYEVKVGKKAQIDLLKTRSDLRASQTQQEILQSNIEITKATLSSLIGKSVKELSPLHIEVKKPRYNVAKLYAKISDLAKVEMEDMALKRVSIM